MEREIILLKNKNIFSKNIIMLFIFLISTLFYILIKTSNLNFLGELSLDLLEPYLDIFENIMVVLMIFSLTSLFVSITKKIFRNYMDRIGRSKKNIKLFLIVYESVVWIIVIILTFSLVFKQIGSLVTSIGLIGFGLTLALQKPILNFVGWITIIFGKTHHIGDIISINNVTGKVYEIRIMYTLISEMNLEGDHTGRAISIPNEFVFMYPVINFSKGTDYIWDSITLNLTYKSNWKKAIKIVEKAVQDYYDKKIKNDLKKVFKDNFQDYEKIVMRFGMYEKGIYIKARYMVDFNKINEVKGELTEILLEKLRTRDIFLGKTENVS